MVAGIIMIGSGLGGLIYTYKSVAQEKITTTHDASIPDVAVRGPLTLKAQANIIHEHVLKITEGKTLAEMPQQIPKLDANGSPVLDKDGQPVMTANTARDIWITATTLITALKLGIIAYAFSGLVFFMGIIFILIGLSFYVLAKRQ